MSCIGTRVWRATAGWSSRCDFFCPPGNRASATLFAMRTRVNKASLTTTVLNGIARKLAIEGFDALASASKLAVLGNENRAAWHRGRARALARSAKAIRSAARELARNRQSSIGTRRNETSAVLPQFT